MNINNTPNITSDDTDSRDTVDPDPIKQQHHLISQRYLIFLCCCLLCGLGHFVSPYSTILPSYSSFQAPIFGQAVLKEKTITIDIAEKDRYIDVVRKEATSIHVRTLTSVPTSSPRKSSPSPTSSPQQSSSTSSPQQSRTQPQTISVESQLLNEVNQKYSEYAYAFVTGGCNPNNPSYRGYIYDILTSTKILRDLGSTNDVVAFFQLSYSYNESNVLPDVDVQALNGYNIRIYYIPPSPIESFYETMMDKFYILQLTQYKRVLFMDGDVMPVANLDFIFHLSNDNAFGDGHSTLKENMVVAGQLEPANGGFFMVTPKKGDYEHIRQIIDQREERVKITLAHNPDKFFDEYEGWGHIIVPPDHWTTRQTTGTNWTFHGGYVDQGLLYHWTKYVKKSVSIVFNDAMGDDFHDRIENLSKGPDGAPKVERVLHHVFANFSKPLLSTFTSCNEFLCHYFHFVGPSKPWLKPPPDDLNETTALSSGAHIWWSYFKLVDAELSLGLDFNNWTDLGEPSLGYYASNWHMKVKRAYKEGKDLN